MKKNEILLKGGEVGFISTNGQIVSRNGDDIFCRCCKDEGLNPSNKNPKDKENAKDMGCIFFINEDKTYIVCSRCGRRLEVTKTYESYQKELDERNKKNLENLHLVCAGEDWECGFKFYTLSANIEYGDWLKVKNYFEYYQRGWSRGQKLEWYGDFEPTGWLTQNPDEVEKILVDLRLIKPENTMKSIQQKKKVEQEKKQKEQEKRKKERKDIIKKIDDLTDKINEAFNIPNKRELSDAEANEHYFNADFFKNNVCVYRLIPNEIVMCQNMGDFKYGVAIPYKQYVKDWIDNLVYWNKQL